MDGALTGCLVVVLVLVVVNATQPQLPAHYYLTPINIITSSMRQRPRSRHRQLLLCYQSADQPLPVPCAAAHRHPGATPTLPAQLAAIHDHLSWDITLATKAALGTSSQAMAAI